MYLSQSTACLACTEPAVDKLVLGVHAYGPNTQEGMAGEYKLKVILIYIPSVKPTWGP